ncbi:MAG: hypothetical protein ACP5GH_07030 [Nitrososphaeria archaeon]
MLYLSEWDSGELKFKEIVEAARRSGHDISKGRVSEALDSLEKNLLVECKKANRKRISCSLTARGRLIRDVLNKLKDVYNSTNESEAIPPSKAQELVESFRRLADRYLSEQSTEVKELYFQEIKSKLGSSNVNVRKVLWEDAAWELLDRLTQSKQELSDDVLELLRFAPYDLKSERAKKYSELLKKWFESESSAEKIDRYLDALLNLLTPDELVDLILSKIRNIDEKAWSSLKIKFIVKINTALSRNHDLEESIRDKVVKMIKENQGEVKNRFIVLYRKLFIEGTQI